MNGGRVQSDKQTPSEVGAIVDEESKHLKPTGHLFARVGQHGETEWNEKLTKASFNVDNVFMVSRSQKDIKAFPGKVSDSLHLHAHCIQLT